MIFKSLLPLYATCVAMAEHISGSEDAFVAKMNEKAQVLGMKHTHFVNCCGLDADGHYTSARDIALMSRELIRIIQTFSIIQQSGWKILHM